MSACQGWGRGVTGLNWTSGGGVGALNDRAERVGQGVPKRSAPDDEHVDRFEDLDPPEDDPSINLHTGKRGLRENVIYVALSLWGQHW